MTMRSALEEKWGVKLEVEHRVWPWLVEYAGHLLTRAEVGADGKTAYGRTRGKVAALFLGWNLEKACCGKEEERAGRWES